MELKDYLQGKRRRLLPLAAGAQKAGRESLLAAVVQEAYVHGVSTRKVDELVKALGMGGISKSRVSEQRLSPRLEEHRRRGRIGRSLVAEV